LGSETVVGSPVSASEIETEKSRLGDGTLGGREKVGGTSRSAGRLVLVASSQSSLPMLVVSESSPRVSHLGVGLLNKPLRRGLSKMLDSENVVSVGETSSRIGRALVCFVGVVGSKTRILSWEIWWPSLSSALGSLLSNFSSHPSIRLGYYICSCEVSSGKRFLG
jgi:hypothetical protein